MRLLRVLGRIFALSVQRELAHRANLVLGAAMSVIEIAASVATLAILFTHVAVLAGWQMAEAMVLLGAYQLVSGLLQTFVEPNLAWFAERVTRGHLDDILLQPLPSLFTVSLGTCQPLGLMQVMLGAVVLGGGALAQGAVLTAGGVAASLFLLAAGVVIAWATRLLLASLAFWAPGLEASVLYFAFWQLGRYPVTVYHPLVQGLLTYVVPVAFIATIPARALTRGPAPAMLLAGLGAALLCGMVAWLVWHAGIRRYTGATS